MTEMLTEWVTLVEFGDAGHGFFCNARASYNPAAAQQAWALTHTFLNCYLGS